jgi:uncharacterized RDD family membrane protein YckC
MENLYIQTSQNVAIEHDVASVGERIIARLLDYLFMGLYMVAVLILIGMANAESPAVFIFFLVPLVLYDLIFEISMNGQSPGKRIIQLQVLMIDGSQPTAGNYFIRWVFRLVDITLTTGAAAVLTIILNGKGQRLGDLAAKTTVIRIKKEVGFSQTLFTQVSDDYVLKYPEVQQLDESDVHTVKEVLTDLTKTNFSSLSVQMASKLKKALEQKMNITTTENYRQFFQDILKDYNYLAKSYGVE